MRRAARTDGNHAEVVSTLRAVGAYVVDLSRVGEGIPDLLVGFRGTWRLFEVKDGSLPPSRQALTPDEHRFHAMVLAKGLPCLVVTSAAEAIKVLTGQASGTSKGLRAVRHACTCGATLVVTDEPRRAAALMASFLAQHQGGACAETDYLAARGVQERIAAARACPRCGAEPDECECPCTRCGSVEGYCTCPTPGAARG